jgi:hypothetical protein
MVSAGHQARREAGAERTLEAVACRPSLDGQCRIDTESLAGPPPPVADLEDPRGLGGPEALYLGTYNENSSTGL